MIGCVKKQSGNILNGVHVVPQKAPGTLHKRASIGGPAFVARRRRASLPQAPLKPPRKGPRRAAGGEKNAIYARIYARKPSINIKKVRLNASRTSKRRVSGYLVMSWRRNELFQVFLILSYT